MQKLELDIYPVGHAFYVARSFKKYMTIKTVHNGYEWEREEVVFEPQVHKRYVKWIEIQLTGDKTRIMYWCVDESPIHRIDTGSVTFGLHKKYSPEEIGMFKTPDEAWAFAKVKADAGEEYHGPKRS